MLDCESGIVYISFSMKLIVTSLHKPDAISSTCIHLLVLHHVLRLTFLTSDLLFQCPPCRGFTPKLVETYKKLKESGKDFEIVFASSDFGEMPWLALPLGDERKEKLSELCNVEGMQPVCSCWFVLSMA